jgi:cytidylate kinase/pantoate ligase/cytidylate kinase
MIITLDGPAGAGKSSTARRLASRLGWCYMDTGAMYRAVALAALEGGLQLDDQESLAALAAALAITFTDGRVLLNGRDVSVEIRTDRVTTATRPVADAPPVREAMKQMQRAMAEQLDVVTEGRDQGSVVFPGAALKIFLVASPEERARRRHRERLESGDSSQSVDDVLAAQTRRDDGDRHRPVGAMEAATDAIRVETDGLSLDQVVEQILALARRRGLVPAVQRQLPEADTGSPISSSQ